MKKIKILIINPSASLGGRNTISNILSLELDKNLFEVFSFFPEKGLAIDQIKEKTKVLFPPKSNFLSIFRFLRDFIKKNEIAIIHTQGTRAAIWTRLAVIGLRKRPKFIYTLHGFHIIRRKFPINWLSILAERFLNHWTDVLVCVSEADKNLVLKYKTISPEKIRVIRNGIDIKRFQISQEKVQEVKKELELENKFVLCSIGRLHPQKDFSTVLRALKMILSQISNARLLIVGDGPLRKSLESETNDLSLNDYVNFWVLEKTLQF